MVWGEERLRRLRVVSKSAQRRGLAVSGGDDEAVKKGARKIRFRVQEDEMKVVKEEEILGVGSVRVVAK